MKLILASTSPRRKELLTKHKYEFEVINPKYEEEEIDLSSSSSPEEFAKYQAVSKAMIVSFEKQGIIVGCDTIVVFEGTVLGKPEDLDDARRILTMLSGNWHDVITGIAMINTETEEKIIDAVKTRVKFKKLSDSEINEYVNTGEPMDKAGSYGIQGEAKKFVEKYEGSYSNVVGLPMEKFEEMLKTLTT